MSLARLLVDAGNSRIKFGLFDDARDADGLPKCWRSATVSVGADLPWSQVRDWLSADHAEAPPTVHGFVAGSNPAEIARVKQDWPGEWPAPVQVGFVAETFPLKFQLPEPNKAGIDRLLNAVAANRLRDASQAAFIVDSGTATTIDAVNGDGEFLGGAILPGFELCARALHHYTALLPLIPLDELPAAPAAVGANTRAAMQSGLYWGQVGAVKELLEQSSRLFKFENPLVLITGGGGSLLMPQFPIARWMPHLSLQGLALLVSPLDS